MCNPASFVLTKDRVFWSKKTDSHAEIIKEFSLCESIRNESAATSESCTLKVEIVPPRSGAFDAPLNEWVFRIDQDITPKWFDAVEDEKRARSALAEWAKIALVREGEMRDVREGDNILAICGGTVGTIWGGNVGTIYGGTVGTIWGGNVEAIEGGNVGRIGDGTVGTIRGGNVGTIYGGNVGTIGGGNVEAIRGGNVGTIWGGTVGTIGGGNVREIYGGTVGTMLGGCIRFFTRFSLIFYGKFSVAIDMTGDRAKCYVGTDKPRTITNIKRAANK